MTKRQASTLTLLGCLVFVLLFLNSQRFGLRFDLSSSQTYSLSRLSKDLYKEIDERVTITYYLSDRIARVHPAPGEIIDLLREYEASSRGRIRVVVEDPRVTQSAAAAERLGVVPQRMDDSQSGTRDSGAVYSGIVVEYLNRTSAIPAVSSIDTLEYDLSSRIRALVRGTPRVIGVVSAAADYDLIARALEVAGWEVRDTSLDADLSPSLSALFVFGGAASLGSDKLERIERYIRSGGGVLFAVEGVAVDSQTDLRAAPLGPSPLLDFLKSYGVFVERELVLDRSSLSLSYASRDPSLASSVRRIRYPLWISILPENVSKTSPLTSNFSGLDLYWASPLRILPAAGVHAEILATTSSRGWRMSKDFAANPEMESFFYAQESTSRGKYPVAAALSGFFPPFFADKSLPRQSSVRPSRIIVVADSDFAGALVPVAGSERNLDFALGAADWLSGDDGLTLLQTRGSRSARLDRIPDPSERSNRVIGSVVLNVAIVPLLVALYALFRLLRRRRLRKRGTP